MTAPRSRAALGTRAARAARIAVAAVVLAAAAFGFLTTSEAADKAGEIVASWQFFPATLRAIGAIGAAAAGFGFASIVAALSILALSALFGRWYCGALCPLGTLQDLAARLGRGKRRYRKAPNLLRAVATLCAIALVLAGSASLASWIDPWSILARFFSYDLQSLVRLASRSDVLGIGAWTLAASATAMAAILVLAVLKGRWFCTSLCPVGSVLGLLNRHAPLKLRLDASACVSCGKCASLCPASCIEDSGKRLDETGCVYCLDCVGACPTGALRYGRARGGLHEMTGKGAGQSRAAFLGTLGAALGGGAAFLALAALPGRNLASRLGPLRGSPIKATTPPGSRSAELFLGSCTACGLCASRCPSQVIQPSLGQLGPRGLFVPILDHSISYCQFECTICSDICPSGALVKMSLERKQLTKIGDASLVRERCIVFTKKTKCGSCAEHCPTGAVRMVESSTGIPEPVFTSSICIGCGACNFACPVRPERAISVSGLAVHTLAEKPSGDLFGGKSAGGTGPGKGEFPF